MSDQAGRRELEEETGGEGSRSVSSTGVGAGRDGGGGGTDCGGFVAGEAPLCVWNVERVLCSGIVFIGLSWSGVETGELVSWLDVSVVKAGGLRGSVSRDRSCEVLCCGG